MKFMFLLILICLTLTRNIRAKHWKKFLQTSQRSLTDRKFSFKTCKICVDLAAESQYDLREATRNTSLANECIHLCMYIELNTNDLEVITACNLLCDMVGVDEFKMALNKSNMDSIYFCELLKICRSKDNGDALITSLIFKPNVVKHGSTFNADIYYISLNGTGTGELAMHIHTPDNKQIEYSYLIQPHAYPGVYEEILDLEARSDPQCNDTIPQNNCIQWPRGIYNVEISKIIF